MKIGTLDREITVQQKSVTKDPEFGTEVITWVPLSVLPGSPEVAERFAANVQDMVPSKSEDVLNGSLQYAANRTRVRMRYRNDIDSSMRVIVHGDTDVICQIVGGPAMLGRREGLEFMIEAYTTEDA